MSDDPKEPASSESEQSPQENQLVAREEDAQVDGKDEEAPSQEPPVIPAIPEQLLKQMPATLRASFESFVAQVTGPGSRPHPIYEKIQPEYIPLLLKSVDQSEKLSFDDAQRKRIFGVIFALLAFAAMAFLVWSLGESNPDLLKELITYVAVAMGGLGGGYGYCEVKRRRN